MQKTFAYTPANLLENITHNSVQGEPVSSMEWDADSNRVSFTSSTGGTTEFMYDITAGIPAVIKETGSKTYVREPDGSLIAMFVGSYPYYYHFDALGSTRMLTDESGHITDSYTYDAWGNVTNHYPNSISQPYQYVGQLGYYTHWQDSNLPLLQLGVRFYDPAVGRFGQRDWLKDVAEPNLYVYAVDQPLFYTDPLGLKALAPGEDWVKKSAKCNKKAFDSCREKIPFGGKAGKGFEKCYWEVYAACMGKAFGKAACEDYYCLLWPSSQYCKGGINPCDNQVDPCHAQDCCDIKYRCCGLAKGYQMFGALECYTDALLCNLKADM
jgi:RHS repeat-associated protein